MRGGGLPFPFNQTPPGFWLAFVVVCFCQISRRGRSRRRRASRFARRAHSLADDASESFPPPPVSLAGYRGSAVLERLVHAATAWYSGEREPSWRRFEPGALDDANGASAARGARREPILRSLEAVPFPAPSRAQTLASRTSSRRTTPASTRATRSRGPPTATTATGSSTSRRAAWSGAGTTARPSRTASDGACTTRSTASSRVRCASAGARRKPRPRRAARISPPRGRSLPCGHMRNRRVKPPRPPRL